MKFQELATPIPLHTLVTEVQVRVEAHKGKCVLAVTGRSRRLAVENHTQELKELMKEHGSVGSEVKKTIGDVATAFVVSACGAGVIVVQASVSSKD